MFQAYRKAVWPICGLLMSPFTHSATYEVSGTFTEVGVYETSGGDNLVVDGSATLLIEGYIVTDSDQPGYRIIDGELTYNGELEISYPPFGSGLVEYDYARGVPDSEGITFYQGGYCSNIVARICQDVDDVASGTFPLTSSSSFLGTSIAGLQLTGGAGGESFSIAQAGGVTPTLGTGPSDWSKAVAFVEGLRDAGLFLEGSLNFTRVPDRTGPQPNIVVVQTNSFPALAGAGRFENIKAIIADEGVNLPHSFVTNPDPTSSLATLLTGLYAHNHGVYSRVSPNALVGGMAWDGWLPKGADPGLESSALPTWLKTAGYRTGFVGKYLEGYGEVAPDTVTDPATYIPPGWDDWHGLVGYSANWMYDYTLNENGTIVEYGASETDYQTDVLAGKAADFILSDDTGPFFLLVRTSAPDVEVLDPLGFYASDDPRAHLDLGIRIAPRHAHLVDGDLSNLEETFPINQFSRGRNMDMTGTPSCSRQPLPVGLSIIDHPFCVQDSPLLESADNVRMAAREKSRYVALRAVDELVLELSNALTSIGQLENTVLIFTSATGGMQGSFNQVDRHLAYEQSIRVPLSIRAPNTLRKLVFERRALITNNDLAPTIARYAGAKPPYDPDGFVRKQVFDGHYGPGEGRDYFLIEHWFMPGFDRFAPPSYLAWRSRGSVSNTPYSSYISTRANPDNFDEVTARELTRMTGFSEGNRVPVPEETGAFFDTVLEVFMGCEGAQCREYERER